MLLYIIVNKPFLPFLLTGGVYYVNDAGQCAQIFNADGPVLTLLHYDEKNLLITVTENMLLTQHFITPEGEAREVMKVKSDDLLQ